MPTLGGSSSGQALYSGMGLDKTQMESVRSLEASFRKEADAMCMRICDERRRLLEQMKDKSASPDVFYRKTEEIGQLQIALEKKVIAHILEVDKSLMPSQS